MPSSSPIEAMKAFLAKLKREGRMIEARAVEHCIRLAKSARNLT